LRKIPSAHRARERKRATISSKLSSAVVLLLQAAAPQQNDWEKVGLALAGVVVGVLLEPVRVWIAGTIRRRQIRELPYRNVARINACLDFACDRPHRALKEKKEIPHSVRYYLGEVSLDVYEVVFNTERTAFYHLPEALALKRFYGFVVTALRLLGWARPDAPGTYGFGSTPARDLRRNPPGRLGPPLDTRPAVYFGRR
jgi:hypothetical protein